MARKTQPQAQLSSYDDAALRATSNDDPKAALHQLIAAMRRLLGERGLEIAGPHARAVVAAKLSSIVRRIGDPL